MVLTKSSEFSGSYLKPWPDGEIFIPGTRFKHLPLCKDLTRPTITLSGAPTDGFQANRIEEMDFVLKFGTYFKGYLGPNGTTTSGDAYTVSNNCTHANTAHGAVLKNVKVSGMLDLAAGGGAFNRRFIMFEGSNTVENIRASGSASSQNNQYGCPFGAFLVKSGASLNITGTATISKSAKTGFCTVKGTVNKAAVKDASNGSYPCN